MCKFISSNLSCLGLKSPVSRHFWGWPQVIAPILLLMSGCVTDAQFLAQNSTSALRIAENRGKFELNCPQVSTTVISQKVIQAVQTGGEYYGIYSGRVGGAWAGPWTEYTVGVRGCGREVVYMAVCRDPDSCNAFSQTASVLNVAP